MFKAIPLKFMQNKSFSESFLSLSRISSGATKERGNISFSRILLLNTAYAVKNKLPDRRGRPNKIDHEVYAKVGEGDYPMGLKAFIHSNGSYNNYLQCKLSELSLLGINSPVNSSSLPKGSWVLEFPITLKKPFMSKDDVPFYIIENPVRKDKVFGIPFTSAMSWKGSLRWTMMKVFLESNADNSDEFAQIRFRHTLLFGTEKGWEETKSWTEYLDTPCSDAREKYTFLVIISPCNQEINPYC